MKIFNVVIGEATGGRWQAFCDFGRALEGLGVEVVHVVRPEVEGLFALKVSGARVLTLRCSGHYDLLATIKAMGVLRQERPDAIMVHCSRSLALMKRAARGRIPVIATLHNQKIKRMLKADAFFCISEHIRRLIATDLSSPKTQPLFVVPNMMEVPAGLTYSPKFYHSPPVLGILSRLVPYKGIDVFIEALTLLRAKGLPFRVVIGGEGESRESLQRQVRGVGLEQEVRFVGWVKEKADFFAGIDIFCLPSIHEPFGIVILEAFLNGKPLVATDADGPLEVCRHGQDALLAHKGDAVSLAHCLETLLLDPQRAQDLARNGFAKVTSDYSMAGVGKQLKAALETVLVQFESQNRS